MTIEEYYAREDVWANQQKRWDLRFGVGAAITANCNLAKGATPLKPGDFFGYEDDPEEDYEMTPEETVQHLKAITDTSQIVAREMVKQRRSKVIR